MIFLIISGENHHFHRTEQILHRQKRHGFIVLGVFDGFFRNHAADGDGLVIPDFYLARFLIQQKIRRDGTGIFLPFFLIFL